MFFAPSVVRRAVSLLPLVCITACLDANREIDWVDESPTSIGLPGLAPFTIDSLPGAAPRSTADARELEAMRPSLERAEWRRAVLRRELQQLPASSPRRASGAELPRVETPPAPDRSLGTGLFPIDDRRCLGSLRLVPTERGQFAAWWSEREGDRVHLLGAWRDVGQQTWRGPIAVDTVDVGSTDVRDVAKGVPTGCARPAPGVAVDGANGYVHVAYALVGPEGPGFFYAHQMDPRAAFEPPVPIVYGERLGTVRVSSEGDYVAVVYEDPNSGTRPRIGLAISRTAGHLFERRVTVNSGQYPASDPFVHLLGSALVVGWSEVPPSGGDTVFLVRRATIR